MQQKLEWKKRPKKRETVVSTIWRWETKDGKYAIERHKYNQTVTYPDAWFAERLPGSVIGNRFRSRRAAERACRLHFNAEQEKANARRYKKAKS